MNLANRTSLAAPLAAILLLAVPAAASTGDAAARAGADPTMPAMLQLAVTRSQAADAAAAYHLDGAGRGANPRHDLELAFTPRGTRLDGPAGGFTLHLERFGRGDGRPVRAAAPHIDGAWVEYDRGAGLTEWFVNLPRGVEQGWTVAKRPAGGGPLVLELDTARAPEERDAKRLVWSGLVYHRLVALDADGQELPAAWTHEGTRLRIEVDDREAAYPVLIDPWVEQAKLTAADGAASDSFGWSVALAGDTALVGAIGADPEGNSDHGAAYVFIRSDGEWSQQAKLTAADGAAGDAFGASAALAGNSALVGAPGADPEGNVNQGAAYVFVPSLVPAALEVDFAPLASSDGNDIFEPGEQVEVAPGWHNNDESNAFGDGILSDFIGPEGATYDIVENGFGYGPIAPGETGSCRDSDTGCYELDIQMTGGTARPNTGTRPWTKRCRPDPLTASPTPGLSTSATASRTCHGRLSSTASSRP